MKQRWNERYHRSVYYKLGPWVKLPITNSGRNGFRRKTKKKNKCMEELERIDNYVEQYFLYQVRAGISRILWFQRTDIWLKWSMGVMAKTKGLYWKSGCSAGRNRNLLLCAMESGWNFYSAAGYYKNVKYGFSKGNFRIIYLYKGRCGAKRAGSEEIIRWEFHRNGRVFEKRIYRSNGRSCG